MSLIRRFVRWVFVIAVLGVCTLLAFAVDAARVGLVEQPPTLIPRPNAGLPAVALAHAAGRGYADSPKENGNVSSPVEFFLPRDGMRHLATVGVDKPPCSRQLKGFTARAQSRERRLQAKSLPMLSPVAPVALVAPEAGTTGDTRGTGATGETGALGAVGEIGAREETGATQGIPATQQIRATQGTKVVREAGATG